MRRFELIVWCLGLSIICHVGLSEQLFGLAPGAVQMLFPNGTVVPMGLPFPSKFVGGSVGIHGDVWCYNAYAFGGNYTLFGAVLPTLEQTWAVPMPFFVGNATTSVVSIAFSSKGQVIAAGPNGARTAVGVVDPASGAWEPIAVTGQDLRAGAIGGVASAPLDTMIIPMVENGGKGDAVWYVLDVPSKKSAVWPLCYKSLSISYDASGHRMVGIGRLSNGTFVVVQHSLPGGDCALLGLVPGFSLIYQQASAFDATTGTLFTILGRDDASPCELVQLSLNPFSVISSAAISGHDPSACFSTLNVFYGR